MEPLILVCLYPHSYKYSKSFFFVRPPNQLSKHSHFESRSWRRRKQIRNNICCRSLYCAAPRSARSHTRHTAFLRISNCVAFVCLSSLASQHRFEVVDDSALHNNAITSSVCNQGSKYSVTVIRRSISIYISVANRVRISKASIINS